jgi:hypothetical protein
VTVSSGSGSDLSKRLDSLTPEKRAIIERQLMARRAQKSAEGGREGRLPVRGPDDPLLLSYSQQQLWFLDQWEPGSSVYNASLVLRFDGHLDVDALRRAIQTIVDRHESLRTVAVDVEGLPTAQLLEHPVFEFHRIDLTASGLPSEEEIVEAARSVVRIPFDLGADLLMRVGLIKVAPDAHVVCMVQHHLACDGLSRGLIFDEMAALYTAYVQGLPDPLPPLQVQYGDFALWQYKHLQGDVLRGEVEFWRNEVAGADFVTELPTDHPRPDVLTFVGGRERFTIPASDADRLRAVGREERATSFMVVHAMTGLLLHGLTGQDDLLVGSPVANRRWPETEPLIGFFINTVLLRLRMRGDPTFRELVRRSRETAVRCYAHQDFPFERVVQAVRPRRMSDRNPLFQVNLRMQGPAPDAPDLPGLTGSRVSIGVESSRFDLALGFIDTPGALDGYVEFNSALFDALTVRRWLELFLAAVSHAAGNPDEHLSVLAAPLREVATG